MRLSIALLAWLLLARPAGAQDTPPAPTAQQRQAESKTTYAVLTKRVEPEYTPEARAAGLQGSVVLYLDVSSAGEVEKAQVIQRLGLGLDEKAIEAAKQWRFTPGTKDGQPVKVAQSAEVSFHLDPINSWQIRRAAYNLNWSATEPVKYLSKPVLSQYTKPGNDACPSSGDTVIVSLEISRQGEPGNIKVIEQHREESANAVLHAIALWRFQPGLVDEKPREGTGIVEMECRASVPGGKSPEELAAALVPHMVGGGVSVPVVLYKVDPEYTEDARKAKYMGTVTLFLQVDTSGHAANLRVLQGLGLGLDEKAMEAVTQWRFKPAIKDGAPVTVIANIAVNFRLL